ncbi:beta-ketoacyl-ACP synthase II [Ferribacterium limneticum]|uniref:beta-ketoacyl-ACP synthase II n=1 Tax=Ferribacterium limneticum TaxID=76259 RepID=UPI001CFB2BBA|nr:beta-ketoacyl-ACP synthase II [Ferribacterium limneticum]UCV30162.1 beta-ketoacyl-ACP synthase II [Ferribacterium limneticum]UCV34081.1 beta-ketoacyl-ACP synthase II [Ferribacterium limneticum]
MARRRVVITGLGLISPVGNSVEEGWQNIIAGRSGIAPVTRFDTSTFPVQFAGEVKNFDITQYISAKDARRMDRFIHYGLAAGMQAVRDAGLDKEGAADPERVGVAIGSGIGGLPLIEETKDEYLAGGVRKVSPFFVPGSIINMISGNLSIEYGFKGPNLAIVTACTTGTHSIGEAARIIEYGDADVMVAGGAESTVSPLGMGGFSAARALSTRNDDPTTASRPWDKDRDGFVLGEGAGVLVLEEYEHAKARGAKIYAEVAGYGRSADAYHITAPNMDGPRRSMVNALKNAGIAPSDVQYVNAHGTSTPLGDKNESDAIKAAFGDAAYKIVVNSTKSMTGHLLGGAGGVESLFTVLAIHHQISPPTINIFNQDPECDLDYCANKARPMKIDVALKNNFGFGGTNGSLVFKRI